MNCPRCHHSLSTDGTGDCRQCSQKLNPVQPVISDRMISDYHRSPIKRGVRQGLLIIVFSFLLAALIQVFTKDLRLPEYSGDIVAVIGLILGFVRSLQIVAFSK